MRLLACLSDFSDETLVNLLLYGNSNYSLEENKEVIIASIDFILSSQRFAGAFSLDPADFFEPYILCHFILDFHHYLNIQKMLLRFCICFVIDLLYAFCLLILFLLFQNLFCKIVLLVKHVNHFDRKKTSDLIKTLKNSKSFGPNSMPTNILKEIHETNSIPLTTIINKSFTAGVFPNMCKIAKVVPIFKS